MYPLASSFTGVLCALALFFIPIQPARACSSIPCQGAAALPGSGATLPANLGGVWFTPGHGTTQATHGAVLRVTYEDATSEPALEEVPRSIAYGQRLALRVEQPFPVGATVTLETSVLCSDEQPLPRETIATWTVGPELPRPATLGTLSVTLRPNGMGRVGEGGGCYEDVPAASAEVVLEADPSAGPWLGAMVFETVVDDEIYRPRVFAAATTREHQAPFGGSWTGRGRDLVFAACDGQAGVALGRHSVKMRGILPDGTVVESEAVEVDLECDSGGGGCGGGAGEPDTTGLPVYAFVSTLFLLRRRRSALRIRRR